MNGCTMRIKYYRGTVTAYDEQHKWYKIKYDDGDGEDLNPKELWSVLIWPKDAEEDDWHTSTSN